jgi:hypothetical protein
MSPHPHPRTHITITLTPLASSQFPQVGSDLANVVGVRSTIMVRDVGRCFNGRIFRGGEFSFTAAEGEGEGLMERALQAVRIRYGSGSSLQVDAVVVPVVASFP